MDHQIRRRHTFSFCASQESRSFNTPNKWRKPPSKDTSWKFPEPRPLICPFRRNLSSVSHPNRPFLLPTFFISSASLTFPDHLLPSYVFPLKSPSLLFFPLLLSFLLHFHCLPLLSICSYFPHLSPSSLTFSFRPLSHPPFLFISFFTGAFEKQLPRNEYSLHNVCPWPASWLGGQSYWLLTMRSRVRFPALACAFFLERGRRPWWPWSG